MFQNNLLMAADAATSGGGAAVTSIGNSAFFNNTNAEDLSRTNDTAQTNTKKWTYSTWIYKCENPVTTANGLLAGGTGTNNSGSLYIYMAFAENPFTTSTGIPTTAR